VKVSFKKSVYGKKALGLFGGKHQKLKKEKSFYNPVIKG